ncbi:AAA family ATPase [Levilactobacillus fuyuanensis]|uniref:Nuclease SbcCD subunit C n=1 Tax=Levilactobacillus fuyuanensis TaxID=2486022 RepID=A0ABW4H4E4_9LACO|nr:SMC family ATPase [Levilactobacillus fuyuanensis]
MRPLSLHLQYFGPYRDEEIDFQKFDATPLFLISGKTGSGKTTIFDGMCYALFDQSSGVDREPQEMRSDFATTADHTRVTFEFNHRNRRYRIIREPAQTLQKKRGSGVTRAAASVELTVFQNGTEIDQFTKTRQVNDYLQDLLQMDGKQFAQIVLLPQGEFRRFLVAPSEDKAAVLEQLFNTEIFAQWTDKLRDKLRQDRTQNAEAAKELERLEASLTWTTSNQARVTSFLQAHQTTEVLTLMAAQQTATQTVIQELSAQATAAQQRVTQLTQQDTREEQLVRDQQQLAKQQERQQKLSTQEPAMNALNRLITELEWTQQIRPQWQERTSAQDNHQRRQLAVEQKQMGLKAAQAVQQKALAAQQKLTSVEARINTTKDQLAQQAKIKPIYRQIAELSQQVVSAQAALDTVQQRVTKAQQQQQQNQQDQQSKQAVIATQTQLYQTQQALTKQAGQLKEWRRQLADLQAGDQRQRDLTQRVASLASQVTTQTQATQVAQQHAEELNQELLAHEIVRLVGQLKPGSPCPVCGSTEHPAPTAIADTTITEAEVQAAQTQAQKEQEQLAKLTTQLQNLQTTLTELKEPQQRGLAALLENVGLSETDENSNQFDQLSQHFAQLAATQQAKQTQNDQQLRAVTTAQHALEQLTVSASKLTQQLEADQIAQQNETSRVDRLTAQLTTQKQQLPATAPTLAVFQQQEENLQQQLQSDQRTWETAVKQVTQANERLTVATTEKKTASQELSQSEQRLAQAVSVVQLLLAKHFETVTDETETIVTTQLAQIDTLTAKRQKLQDFRTQQEQVTTTITELKKRVLDQPEPDRNQTQVVLKAAAEKVAILQDQRHGQQDQYQHNQQVTTQLQERIDQQAAALKESQELTELVGVVNGDGPNSKLGLERYVLQTYLRQILTVGNQRLQQLTNGRYQFLVDDQPATYKKNSGLEINVYDDHVGEQRSVHTLSGGESFIAALALALALGEVIQQTTGSVDVDALFIDEGFGSLDEDALMTALESLETVEGKHRMIGIISHVSELRAQVPNQLQVVSNGNGESKITYQIDES